MYEPLIIGIFFHAHIAKNPRDGMGKKGNNDD